MKSINPATGQLIAEYPVLVDQELQMKIARSHQRYLLYRLTPFAVRADWMRRAAGLLRNRLDDYAALMTREMGKPIGAARAEVEKCAWVCQYYADNAEMFLADEPVLTDADESYVAFRPVGPVLAVMPWNFPFWQCFRFAAPALMAGNVGLLKHASNVPGCALAIEEVFLDAGFPEGCFQSLLVGSSAVQGIIADPRVAAVTLTGSEAAGVSVGAAAGGALKKVVLELGGSDPFIVMPGADLDQVVPSAVSARTVNNGQSCIAAKRFIIHRSVLDEFEKRFADGFRDLRMGDPSDPSVQIGPLARPEFVSELHVQVAESVVRGARLVTGGRVAEGPGYFYEPTILSDVLPGMPVYDQETFGPVAAVIAVDSLDQAIAVANDTRFGLGASAWTPDADDALRLIEEIDAGSVFINGIVKSDPRLPFGGVKASGVGRELSVFGIREFVNVKTVWKKNQ